MSEALLELAAEILGPLVEEVVFVGGATVHLWITEPAAGLRFERPTTSMSSAT